MPPSRTPKLVILALLGLSAAALILSESSPRSQTSSTLLQLLTTQTFYEIPAAGRELAASDPRFHGYSAGYGCTRIGFAGSDLFVWDCHFRARRGRVQIELSEARRLSFEARYSLIHAGRSAWVRYGAWGVVLGGALLLSLVWLATQHLRARRFERAFQKRAEETQKTQSALTERTQAGLREIVKHYWTPDPAHATSDPRSR